MDNLCRNSKPSPSLMPSLKNSEDRSSWRRSRTFITSNPCTFCSRPWMNAEFTQGPCLLLLISCRCRILSPPKKHFQHLFRLFWCETHAVVRKVFCPDGQPSVTDLYHMGFGFNSHKIIALHHDVLQFYRQKCGCVSHTPTIKPTIHLNNMSITIIAIVHLLFLVPHE